MKNFVFLVPVKSVLGSSILHYSCRCANCLAMLNKHVKQVEKCFKSK